MSSSPENIIRIDAFSPCLCATRSKWGDLDIISHLERCIDQWDWDGGIKINVTRRGYAIKSALEGIGLKCCMITMRRKSTMRSCSGQEVSFDEYVHALCLSEHYENHDVQCRKWKEVAQRIRGEACAQIDAEAAWEVVAKNPWNRDEWSIVWEMIHDFNTLLPLKLHIMSQAERYLISQRTIHSNGAQEKMVRL